MKCSAVIMAAGEGTRMKSATPKVLHKAAGRALLGWAARAAEQANVEKPIVIYGSGGNAVPDYFMDRFTYVCQQERLGSGHAVMCAYDAIKQEASDYCLVLAGDMPLLRGETLCKLIEMTEQCGYDAVLLSAVFEDAFGYGRIVRDESGNVLKIVEHKDASPEELEIKEINASVYCFKTSALLEALPKIKNDNLKGEYYLTDAIELIRAVGGKVGAMVLDDATECMGVNTRVQLAEAAKVLYKRKVTEVMLLGVTVEDPDTVYIDMDVTVGRDAVIYQNNTISGTSVIGERAVINPGCIIKNSTIGEGAEITCSVIDNCNIAPGEIIGPFAHIKHEV